MSLADSYCHITLFLTAEPNDFTVPGPFLTIPSGESGTCLALQITEDLSLEYDETFMLHLEADSEDVSVVSVIGNENTSITIINNDSENFWDR